MKDSKSRPKPDIELDVPEEIVPNIAPQSVSGTVETDSEPVARLKQETPPDGFDPLGMAPPKAAKRYEKAAAVAHTQPMKAIKLMCLSCVCWDFGESKRCQIQTCPLWALNRQIFGKRGADDGC